MDKELILASGSPRRKELLQMLKIPFRVVLPVDFEELTGLKEPNPSKLVLFNAQGKAQSLLSNHPNSLILGVDTVVALDGQILEKPKDEEDAARMLRLLQGKRHKVHTGHFLQDNSNGKTLWIEDTSIVEFLPMTEEQIRAYIATGEPMDKAGAYAVQGLGARFIKKIDGDFFGVMGLSVSKFMKLYEEINLK